MNIAEKVKNAGVVGAGGAGFPAHVKISAKAERVLVNGASCEPLLMSDPYLMTEMPQLMLDGLAAVLDSVGAKQGTICIKRKHPQAIAAMRAALEQRGDSRLDIFELEDFYPAGDEHVLVHEVTGRVVPQGGIPLQVGLVVNNTESLINIARALQDKPVTARWFTVAGEVAKPMVLRAPIGMSAAEIVEFAGGALVEDYRLVDGGPMMGRVLNSPDTPISKTTSGILVLPADHNVIVGKNTDPAVISRISKIACCQCTLCTEMCPRYLLGHGLHPHKLMRQIDSIHEASMEIQKEALLCSECGICEKFACPMMISPREVNLLLKRDLMAQGIRLEPPAGEMKPSAFMNLRKVPSKRLMERIEVSRYAAHPLFHKELLQTKRVTIPLSQHIGAPAQAVVKKGDAVTCGQLIGQIPPDALGANLHASIDGRVQAVNQQSITIVT